MLYQILLVEDDLENCDILTHYLSKSGQYVTTVAHDATEALQAVTKRQFDLILLDIMLPGIDGIELCVQLREQLYCPIIFISCLDDEETIIRALRMGGDDYITKPFRYPILQAHMEAALRRVQQHIGVQSPEKLCVGDMVLSIREHALRRGEIGIILSPIEFDLLLYFLNNEGTVLRFEEIYRYIWKKPSLGDLRTVYSHVRNLRKKIERDASNPQLLITIPRVGYRFSNDE